MTDIFFRTKKDASQHPSNISVSSANSSIEDLCSFRNAFIFDRIFRSCPLAFPPLFYGINTVLEGQDLYTEYSYQ